MKETKELPRKVMGNIRDYIEILFNGEKFTVDDVCEVTGYFNKNHLDNYLCGFGFRTSLIERAGNYFIKKGYSDGELKSLVKNVMYKYGSIQPNVFLEDLNGVTKKRLGKILENGCTKDGWIVKESNGEIIYFR